MTKKLSSPRKSRKTVLPGNGAGGRTSEASTLLEAVLAAPDDDAPRLVYADWLLEQSDPRGELIQLQCALGVPRNASGSPRWAYLNAPRKRPPNEATLEKREIALLKKHQKSWIEPFRSAIYAWIWRRGFVEIVEAKGEDFLNPASAPPSERTDSQLRSATSEVVGEPTLAGSDHGMQSASVLTRANWTSSNVTVRLGPVLP